MLSRARAPPATRGDCHVAPAGLLAMTMLGFASKNVLPAARLAMTAWVFAARMRPAQGDPLNANVQM